MPSTEGEELWTVEERFPTDSRSLCCFPVVFGNEIVLRAVEVGMRGNPRSPEPRRTQVDRCLMPQFAARPTYTCGAPATLSKVAGACLAPRRLLQSSRAPCTPRPGSLAGTEVRSGPGQVAVTG